MYMTPGMCSLEFTVEDITNYAYISIASGVIPWLLSIFDEEQRKILSHTACD